MGTSTVKRVAAPAKFRLTRPTVPESAVLEAVLSVMTFHPAVAWAGRMNSGAMLVGKRYVRFNTIDGISDVIGQLKSRVAGQPGAFLAIECKRVGEKPTAQQQSFLDQVARNGGFAFVAYDSDAVWKALNDFQAA